MVEPDLDAEGIEEASLLIVVQFAQIDGYPLAPRLQTGELVASCLPPRSSDLDLLPVGLQLALLCRQRVDLCRYDGGSVLVVDEGEAPDEVRLLLADGRKLSVDRLQVGRRRV